MIYENDQAKSQNKKKKNVSKNQFDNRDIKHKNNVLRPMGKLLNTRRAPSKYQH